MSSKWFFSECIISANSDCFYQVWCKTTQARKSRQKDEGNLQLHFQKTLSGQHQTSLRRNTGTFYSGESSCLLWGIQANHTWSHNVRENQSKFSIPFVLIFCVLCHLFLLTLQQWIRGWILTDVVIILSWFVAFLCILCPFAVTWAMKNDTAS